MREDKEKVLKLRRMGKSYNEIRQKIKIPKSTLSEWLSKVSWSKKIKKILNEKAKEKSVIHLRNLDKIRGMHLAQIYKEARDEAQQEFKHFKFYPLFIAGISIYWGEGDKRTRNLVRISNTDPLMIRIFVKFLKMVCNVNEEKIRVSLLLYPDLDESKCKNFWIKQSKLSYKNFNKSIIIQGRHKTRRIQYGVCMVCTSSTYLKEKMMLWMHLLPKELVKGKYYLRE